MSTMTTTKTYTASIAEAAGGDSTTIVASCEAEAMDKAAAWAKSGNWPAEDGPAYVTVCVYGPAGEHVGDRRVSVR